MESNTNYIPVNIALYVHMRNDAKSTSIVGSLQACRRQTCRLNVYAKLLDRLSENLNDAIKNSLVIIRWLVI